MPSDRICLNRLRSNHSNQHKFTRAHSEKGSKICQQRLQDPNTWVCHQNAWWRKDNKLAILYRIQNDLVDINRIQYLTGGDSRTHGAHKFYQQRITHDVYNNSFFPRTIRDWNTLPATVADAGSLEDFRLRLQATHYTRLTPGMTVYIVLTCTYG
jgi:hypothetical protein